MRPSRPDQWSRSAKVANAELGRARLDRGEILAIALALASFLFSLWTHWRDRGRLRPRLELGFISPDGVHVADNLRWWHRALANIGLRRRRTAELRAFEASLPARGWLRTVEFSCVNTGRRPISLESMTLEVRTGWKWILNPRALERAVSSTFPPSGPLGEHERAQIVWLLRDLAAMLAGNGSGGVRALVCTTHAGSENRYRIPRRLASEIDAAVATSGSSPV